MTCWFKVENVRGNSNYHIFWTRVLVAFAKKIYREEEKNIHKLHLTIRVGDNCTVDEPLPAAAVQGPICGLVPPALAINLSAHG